MTTQDDVAVITMDDGKVNVFSHTSIDLFNEALDVAEAEAGAVLVVGREGKFSAGFDLSVMSASEEERDALVRKGGELMMRIYGFGAPVVAACTGHALAAGAIMLMACDTRFGADTESAKIGMNEVNIGMSLPTFATVLARERLSKRHITQAAALGQIYNPAAAETVGYLDHVVPASQLMETALAHAQSLAQYCRKGAVRGTKRNLRGAVIDEVLAGLDDERNKLS